jgi:hypothetical protein
MNNNINSLTFEHHDTYIFYVDELLNTTQSVKLTPTNPYDIDTVTYTSRETNLFINSVNNGVIKFNTFTRSNFLNKNNPIGLTLATIITSDGILMYNYASEGNSSGSTISGIQTKSLATYKSGKYANYINVEIQVDFEDGYRIVTISY